MPSRAAARNLAARIIADGGGLSLPRPKSTKAQDAARAATARELAAQESDKGIDDKLCPECGTPLGQIPFDQCETHKHVDDLLGQFAAASNSTHNAIRALLNIADIVEDAFDGKIAPPLALDAISDNASFALGQFFPDGEGCHD